MKISCILFVILISCICSQAWADNVCGSNPVPFVVSVVSINQPVEYDFTRSSDQIAGLGVDAPPGNRTHGLTSASFELDLDVGFSSSPVTGGVCVAPYQVKIKVGYTSMKVYVDNAYPQGSCQWRTILQHEKTHVGFDLRVLGEFTPRFKQAIETVLTQTSLPEFYPNINQAKTVLSQKLKLALSDPANQMKEERNQLNGSIDTPESYFETAQECGEW